MVQDCSIKHEDGITTVYFLKRPTFQDTQLIIDKIVENYPYEKRLWDLSGIVFDFTMDEIRRIADYGKTKFTKPNRIAIVASCRS